jgi:hypothetical protein
VDPLPRTPAQGVELLLRPGFDMVQPVVGPREDMAQPDHRYPAQAEAYPMAMGGKVLVQQRLYPHALELNLQQGDVIDAFTDDIQGLGHAKTLPPCSKLLQI